MSKLFTQDQAEVVKGKIDDYTITGNPKNDSSLTHKGYVWATRVKTFINSMTEPKLKYMVGDGQVYRWDGTDGISDEKLDESQSVTIRRILNIPNYNYELNAKDNTHWHVAEASLTPIVDEAPDVKPRKYHKGEKVITKNTFYCSSQECIINHIFPPELKSHCINMDYQVKYACGFVQNVLENQIEPADKPDGFKVGDFGIADDGTLLRIDRIKENGECTLHDMITHSTHENDMDVLVRHATPDDWNVDKGGVRGYAYIDRGGWIHIEIQEKEVRIGDVMVTNKNGMECQNRIMRVLSKGWLPIKPYEEG